MTAVAPFPSVPRSGWTTGSQPNGNMSQDEVARLFMPRKGSQRGPHASPVENTAWTNGQIRNGNSFQEGLSPVNNGGSMKSKKTARGVPWPQKDGLIRPGNGVPGSMTNGLGAMHQQTPVVPSQNRGAQSAQGNGTEGFTTSILMLLPLNNSFDTKFIPLPFYPETLRIGRQTNAKTVPTPSNGYFDSKVLSRQHAEVWAEPKTGKVWIRDVKSSNGTFVNGQRLSQENKDSEPHELRAEDILELGIDIFSEDNKTIIHHKVAARVEHAGFQNGMNVDLNNLGEMDNLIQGGLSQLNTLSGPNNMMRGRSASQNSRTSAAPGGPMGPRNIPIFIPSISVEQIVKRLNSELHTAKQQSQELQRTSDFFDSLLTLEVADKNNEIKRADSINSDNGDHSPIIDSGVGLDASGFNSEPRAPMPPPAKHITVTPEGLKTEEILDSPPAQSPQSPLSPRSRMSRSFDKCKDRSDPSPQQIFSLVAQLRDARLELEAKSAKVKDLEDLLRKERKAREDAEDRAARLESTTNGFRLKVVGDGTPSWNAEGKDDEKEEDDDTEYNHMLGVWDSKTGHEIRDDVSVAGSDITVRDADFDEKSNASPGENLAHATATAAAEAAAIWQRRVEEMMVELQAAKEEIEQYKKTVKIAEEEKQQSRRTLEEMVAQHRAENERRERRRELKESSAQTSDTESLSGATMVNSGVQADDIYDEKATLVNTVAAMSNGSLIVHSGGKSLHKHAPSTELLKHQRSVVRESVPYVSIVGVVVIGVGIMAILNTWPKGER